MQPANKSVTRASGAVRELESACEAARRLATEIHHRLTHGEHAAKLIPHLRQLSDGMADIQRRVGELGPRVSEFTNPDRLVVGRLIATFPKLVHLVGANHRLAAQAGVPISGLGGKPYRPQPNRARKRSARSSAGAADG